MDYFDNNADYSVNEFYEQIEKLRKNLKKQGILTPEILEEKKSLLLGLQFTTPLYIEKQEENPEWYPDVNLDAIKEEIPFIDAVYEHMVHRGNGKEILDKISVTDATILVTDAHKATKRMGIVDSVKERIVGAVVPAIENVTKIAINDTSGVFVKPSGKYATGDILKRYPKLVKTMTDEVTRSVFTNKVEEHVPTSIKIQNGNKIEHGMIVLTPNSSLDSSVQTRIEKKFSYYDWAVMEAVASLYEFAKDNKKLKNGKLIVDLESIDKLIKRDIKARSDKANILDSELVSSILKLLNNHISISDPSGNYEGDLLEGEWDIISGNVCLVIDEPIMLKYGNANGRNYIDSLDIEKLKLDGIHFTAENIAIYRFLLDRLRIIFGSYFMDKTHVNTAKTNSVLLSSIIDAVYPEGLQGYVDADSKRRFVWEHAKNICEAMKDNKNFFLDFDPDGVNPAGEKTIRFERK